MELIKEALVSKGEFKMNSNDNVIKELTKQDILEAKCPECTNCYLERKDDCRKDNCPRYDLLPEKYLWELNP